MYSMALKVVLRCLDTAVAGAFTIVGRILVVQGHLRVLDLENMARKYAQVIGQHTDSNIRIERIPALP